MRFLTYRFVQALREDIRLAPRRYFSPLVGAIAGLIEYTDAAWKDIPVGRHQAQLYARLLSAIANAQIPDGSYNRQLIEAVLRSNKDRLHDVLLNGDLSDDLKAFGGRQTAFEGPVSSNYDATVTTGRRFAKRFSRTMVNLAKKAER